MLGKLSRKPTLLSLLGRKVNLPCFSMGENGNIYEKPFKILIYSTNSISYKFSEENRYVHKNICNSKNWK